MTSEMLIMNKDCVAMAADSAATLFGEKTKIYEANKVFALSKQYPVGLMTYQSPIISGVPVETLVKEYRKYALNNREKEIGTIDKYGENFLDFIEKGYPTDDDSQILIISEKMMETNAIRCILSLWESIMSNIGEQINDAVEKKMNCNSLEIKLSPDKMIKNILLEIESKERTPRDLDQKYISSVKKGLDNIFKSESFKRAMNKTSNPIAAKPYLKRIKSIFQNMVLSEEPFWDTTGIVIAGFGESQIFPAFVEYNVDGCFWGKLKFKEIRSGEISDENSAMIIPFAQGDVAATFIEGIDPDIKRNIIEKFRGIISDVKDIKSIGGSTPTKDVIDKAKELALNDFIDVLNRSTLEKSNPIIRSVKFLSKKEMGHMAESMINLTSLRRRMSVNSDETVGGPVDVAIISKGDGLIWIKRKHYFDVALNPHYNGSE